MAYHDRKALSCFLCPTTWKRFCDDVSVGWKHGADTLPSFLYYLNNVDEARKIKLATEIASHEKSLEILDLGTTCVEGKLSVDDSTKPNNGFTYVIPYTCYRKKKSKSHHVEMLLDYAEYVTLMRNLNLMLMNIRNI